MSRATMNVPRQSGAALALSLMMLAILTVIGVASMNSTLLEMLMAGNLQFQTTTLINAENTLTTAEQAVETSTLANYNGATNGMADITQVPALDPLTMVWQASDSVEADVATNRYQLEHTGTQTPPGNSNSWGGAGAGTQEVIRITAHSQGTKGTVRMVQSIYVR